MMLKIVIAIGLLISLSFLVNEGSRSILPGEQVTSRPVKIKGGHSVSRQKKTEFYPEVPASLPDLRDGYLFNEGRMLAAEEERQEEEDLTGEYEEIKVNMNDVMYVGSLIRGDVRRGLVSYPAQRKKTKSKGTVKRTKKKTLRSSKNRDYARILVGESFSDYKVVEIEADRIKFEKRGKTVVKFLNDPGKNRLTPPKVENKRRKGLNKTAAKSTRAVTSKRQRVKVRTATPRTRRVVPSPLTEHDDFRD
ncbi:MAG: hypothetical protein U9R66_10775 [Thermodesulfobacteriota bacterium]|nr:hypothetical protein [Thermodesulfobacteriota bacterium]